MATRRYTPFYCEENIWWLAQEPELVELARDVVFVTNAQRSVAVFAQRAGRGPDRGIVWDYHVVLAVHVPGGTEVWDLDSVHGAPLPAGEWLATSFSRSGGLPDWLQPRFRIVPAAAVVATLVSDRSHMRLADGRWRAPPPAWPCIGHGAPNLERFLELGDPSAGDVLDLEALHARWEIGPKD